MSYIHITTEERESIHVMLSQGKSESAIASNLHRSKSTINREIMRNSTNGSYRIFQAEKLSKERKKLCGATNKLSNDPILTELIHERLLEKHSPEQIKGRMEMEGLKCVSFKTIYRCIENGILSIPKKCLRQGGKKRRKLSTDKRGQIPGRVMITDRPKEIETRSELGHYESDTVVGKDHQSAVVTHVERKSRYLFVAKLKETGSLGVLEATKLLFRNIPKEALKTFTSDNGKEFSKFQEISKFLEISFYFALPHHPWERGTNENTNGLLRQYFPKGTDFNKITDQEIQDVATKLNNRPRKVLNYKTPHEFFWADLNSQLSCT